MDDQNESQATPHRRPRRVKKRYLSLVISFVALGIGLAQYYGWFDGPVNKLASTQPGLYNINHFVDGDTIAVDMNGTVEKIRMIGVDTPETHKPNTPVQCYGPAAAAYTKNLIGSSRVRLEVDPLSSNRDRYNRLLRYVYLPDGRMVAAELIKNGYGFAYTYFPFSKSAEFVAYQQAARTDHRGLWGNCTPTPNKYGGYTSNSVGT